jgi:hypothetical protein
MQREESAIVHTALTCGFRPNFRVVGFYLSIDSIADRLDYPNRNRCGIFRYCRE